MRKSTTERPEYIITRMAMTKIAADVMSWLRANAPSLGIDPAVFDKTDFHIHVPAGAIPKDGPSAGVTMTVSLASLLTGIPVPSDLAMTGEITLRGKVLPVGGIKEKVIAAKSAGITRVIIPDKNEKDLEDVSEPVRTALTFHFVHDIEQVLDLAFGEPLRQRLRSLPTYTESPAAGEPVVTVVGVDDPMGDSDSEGDTPVVRASPRP